MRDDGEGRTAVAVPESAGSGGAAGAGSAGSMPGSPGAGRDGATLTHWGPAMATLIVGAFMALLDSSIVNVAIPTLERVFGVGTNSVEWVVTIYLLALGVVVPTSGWLGDRLGFKRLYILSILLFALGSGLCAIAPGLPFLVAARVLQALGGGMIMPTTMSMAYRIVPRSQIGLASGYYGMAMLLAPALGPTVGGYLVEYWNWRWIFTINVPIGVAGAILATAVLPEFQTRPAGRFDVPGAATASVGLFGLLLALSEGGTWGWQSQAVTWLFFVAGVCLLAFVWVELSVANPLHDLGVFRYGAFTASTLFMVAISIALFASTFFIPLYLQLVDGKGALATGLILMPGALVTGLFMPVGGRLYDRLGPLPPVLCGVAILTVATFLFRNLGLETPDAAIAGWVAFRGVGMGLAMMPANTAGMIAIPQDLLGRASAVSNIIQRVAASFGIAVLTVLITNGTAAQETALGAELAPGSPSALALRSWLAGAAATPAGLAEAMQRLGQYVQAVAFTRSVDDMFVLLTGISLVCLVPALFLRGRKPGRGPARPSVPIGLD